MASTTPEEIAKSEGWTVTLSHRDAYVAHYEDEEEPTHELDADTEEDAWAELCELEGLIPTSSPR